MQRTVTFGLLLMLALGQLHGCSHTPPKAPAALGAPPSFQIEALSRTTQQTTVPASTDAWWQVFQDPTLNDLVERGQAHNTQIRQAAARVAQAAALRRATGSMAQPTVGLAAGASRRSGPLVNAAGDSGNLFNMELQLGYEIDLLARAERSEQASQHDLKAQEALLRQIRLLVQAETAQTYFAWRGLQRELAVLKQIEQSWREQFALAERHQQLGLGTVDAVTELRLAQRAAQAQTQGIERQLAVLGHALAFLVGDAAMSNLPDGKLDTTLGALPVIPAGIPAQVLARRADMVAAQESVAAEQLRLGVAHEGWLPRLRLTTSGGTASSRLRSLLEASSRGMLSELLLSLPLWDGGRQQAQREASAASLNLALARQDEVLLTALRDVNDQLSQLASLADEWRAQLQAQEQAAQSLMHTESLQRNGLRNQHAVLQAKRLVWQQQLEQQRLDTAQRLATVGLVRALGGGWDEGGGPPSLATLDSALGMR